MAAIGRSKHRRVGVFPPSMSGEVLRWIEGSSCEYRLWLVTGSQVLWTEKRLKNRQNSP
jgi:hypothetical protein